jgi:arachidonate 15-lipoxygenase
MTPYLPHQEPHPAQRSAALEKQRQRYGYDFDKSPPLALLAQDVPDQDKFSSRYIAERLAATAELTANLLTSRVRSVLDPLDELAEYDELFPILPLPAVAQTYQTDASFAE